MKLFLPECDSQCSEVPSPMEVVQPHVLAIGSLVPVQKSSPERRNQKEIVAGEERPKFLTVKQTEDAQGKLHSCQSFITTSIHSYLNTLEEIFRVQTFFRPLSKLHLCDFTYLTVYPTTIASFSSHVKKFMNHATYIRLDMKIIFFRITFCMFSVPSLYFYLPTCTCVSLILTLGKFMLFLKYETEFY